MEPLSRYFSVYAMDLPGCGFSQRTNQPECRLAGDAEGVLRFMEHFGIENADIVGSSRAAAHHHTAALASRTNRLHRIRRLVLFRLSIPGQAMGKS